MLFYLSFTSPGNHGIISFVRLKEIIWRYYDNSKQRERTVRRNYAFQERKP